MSNWWTHVNAMLDDEFIKEWNLREDRPDVAQVRVLCALNDVTADNVKLREFARRMWAEHRDGGPEPTYREEVATQSAEINRLRERLAYYERAEGGHQ